jgi:hypothetical protein
MRGLALIPFSILIVAASGIALCKIAGWPIGTSGLFVAGITSAVAAGLAFVPLLLARGGSQAAQAQAALVGTMVHLFIAVVVTGAVLLLKPPVAGSFVYWMLAFYWTTLTVLVVSFTRNVRLSSATSVPANKQ